MVALVLQTPMVVDALCAYAGSGAELTSTQFHDFFLHFSPSSLDITTCYLRACQVTDGLIRALSKSHAWRAKFPNMTPRHGCKFPVRHNRRLLRARRHPDRQRRRHDPAARTSRMLWQFHEGHFQASARGKHPMPLCTACAPGSQALPLYPWY